MSVLITNKAAKAGDGGFAIHLYDDVYIDSECVDAAFAAVFLKGGEKYCDRNICASNEVNGISCDECEVAKYHNLEDDDTPCQNCEEPDAD